MTDKDLEKILYKYADIVGKKNSDLDRFNARNKEDLITAKKKIRFKNWAYLAVLVVVICVSIAVPLSILRNQSNGETELIGNEQYYLDMQNIETITIDNIDEFNKSYGYEVENIKCNYLFSEHKVLSERETKKVVGIQSFYFVGDELIESVELVAYTGNARLTGFQKEDAFNKIKIGSMEYLYIVDGFDENSNLYYLRYQDQSIEYDMQVRCYYSVDIMEIIDKLLA